MMSEYSEPIFRLIVFWLGLLVLAHSVAACSSTLYADTEREQRIPAWPPKRPLGAWFERVWFAPFERWDTNHYVRIVSHEYSARDGTAQFHPLYPCAARLLAALGLPALIALSLVAFLSSLLLIVALYAWARVDCGPDGAWHTVFLFITSPFAFVLVLPYSEPLFLLMTGLFFIFLRKRQWIRAGLAGAMATLTRQQGLFFAVPLVISLAGDAEWKLRRIVDNWHDWISVAFIPLAYTGWIAYRAFALKDLQPDFSSLREFVYSVLISPNAVRVVPVQTFTWPWRAMALAVRKVLNAPDGDIWLNLIFAGLFLILTRMAWQKLQLASKVYTVLIVLLSFSYSTGPVHPYMGLVRHLLLALPVFIGLGKSVTSTPKRMILIASGVVGQMVLVMAFVLHIWVP